MSCISTEHRCCPTNALPATFLSLISSCDSPELGLVLLKSEIVGQGLSRKIYVPYVADCDTRSVMFVVNAAGCSLPL